MEEQRNEYENESNDWEELPENPIDGSSGGGRVKVEEGELSVASGFSTEEDELPDGAARSIEWEIMLTKNNFRRNVDDVELDIETAEYVEVIFGGFDTAHSAAKAYDRAAIKFRGVDVDIIFVLSDYEEDLKLVRSHRT